MGSYTRNAILIRRDADYADIYLDEAFAHFAKIGKEIITSKEISEYVMEIRPIYANEYTDYNSFNCAVNAQLCSRSKDSKRGQLGESHFRGIHLYESIDKCKTNRGLWKLANNPHMIDSKGKKIKGICKRAERNGFNIINVVN